MDILIINETPRIDIGNDYLKSKLNLIVTLSNDNERFLKKIKTLKSNEIFYNKIRDKVEDFLTTQENYKLEDSNIIEIFFYGEVKKYSKLKTLIKPYRIKKCNILRREEPFYREFTRTLARQRETDWLVNVTPDVTMSYNSLQRATIKPYGFIISIQLIHISK